MSENNTDSTAAETTGVAAAQEQQAAKQAGGAAEVKTFTQEEVNAIVEKRISRVKSTPPADYEELKAKAAKYDELEEAKKSELEKANEATARAKARADEAQAKYEALEAEVQRAKLVREKAAEYGVDAEMLARMEGDVEDNAAYLKARDEAIPKFGDVHDGGEQQQTAQTLEDIRKIKDPVQRVKARTEFFQNNS